jgi:hypothetical protein
MRRRSVQSLLIQTRIQIAHLQDRKPAGFQLPMLTPPLNNYLVLFVLFEWMIYLHQKSRWSCIKLQNTKFQKSEPNFSHTDFYFALCLSANFKYNCWLFCGKKLLKTISFKLFVKCAKNRAFYNLILFHCSISSYMFARSKNKAGDLTFGNNLLLLLL